MERPAGTNLSLTQHGRRVNGSPINPSLSQRIRINSMTLIGGNVFTTLTSTLTPNEQLIRDGKVL